MKPGYNANVLDHVTTKNDFSDTARNDEDKRQKWSQHCKASSINVNSLTNRLLCAIQCVIGNPYSMMMKFKKGYGSKVSISESETVSELLLLKFIKHSGGLTKHIGPTAPSVEQLTSTKTQRYDTLGVHILVDSILDSALQIVTTAIKTFAVFKLIWDSLFGPLFEKQKETEKGRDTDKMGYASAGNTAPHASYVERESTTHHSDVLIHWTKRKHLSLPTDT